MKFCTDHLVICIFVSIPNEKKKKLVILISLHSFTKWLQEILSFLRPIRIQYSVYLHVFSALEPNIIGSKVHLPFQQVAIKCFLHPQRKKSFILYAHSIECQMNPRMYKIFFAIETEEVDQN